MTFVSKVRSQKARPCRTRAADSHRGMLCSSMRQTFGEWVHVRTTALPFTLSYCGRISSVGFSISTSNSSGDAMPLSPAWGTFRISSSAAANAIGVAEGLPAGGRLVCFTSRATAGGEPARFEMGAAGCGRRALGWAAAAERAADGFGGGGGGMCTVGACADGCCTEAGASGVGTAVALPRPRLEGEEEDEELLEPELDLARVFFVLSSFLLVLLFLLRLRALASPPSLPDCCVPCSPDFCGDGHSGWSQYLH